MNPRLEMPLRSFMTPCANGEVVSAKRTLAVVTCHAARCSRRCMMIQRDWTCYLPANWEPWSNSMTVTASQLFRCVMLGVTKPRPKSGGSFARPDETAKLMTCAAGRKTSPIRLRLRGMTTKASRMCTQPGRNRKRYPSAITSMAGGASGADGRVASVIKPHIKAQQSRKTLNSPCLNVRVTDIAHRTIRVTELLRVATCARCMVGFSGQCRER